MNRILQKIHKEKKGLTSIELVVVFAIFAALASSILFGYREFSTNIKLQNLAQDMALQIRQAQNRSVSGFFPPLSDQQIGPSANWAPSYGLYFSRLEDENRQFSLFFDDNEAATVDPVDLGNKVMDGLCDGNIDSECFDIIQITNGEFIESICLNELTTGSCESVDDVYITFTRPLNRAYIIAGVDAGDTLNNALLASDVSIYFESPAGNIATVRVTAAGQIIVE